MWRFAIQKRLLILLLLEDIVDWALFTSSTNCFIKANLARRWAPKHARCSLQICPWRDASQYAWCSIGTRVRASWLLSRCNICSLRAFVDWLVATNRRSITLLYKHRIHSLNFLLSRTDWNSQNFWTMNTQNLYTLQAFRSFSHKCKSLFLQSCPKEFIRFHCECTSNLLKGNLQSIKRYHVTKFQNEDRLLSLKKITWNQRKRSGVRKMVTTHKVITPPLINHLSWYGGVCSRPYFCVQQQGEFEYSGNYKRGASKVSSWTKSHLANWLPRKGNKRKAVCESRLFSRQKFVLSSYQALKFADFNIGWYRNWSFTVRLCSTTLS